MKSQRMKTEWPLFAKSVLDDVLRLTVEAMEYDLTYQFDLEVGKNWTDVLIRPDKPVYNENEAIPLSIMKQRDGKVWIYAVKNGQIITAVGTEEDKTELMLPKGTYGLIDLVYGFQETGRVWYNPWRRQDLFLGPETYVRSKENRVYAPAEHCPEAKDQNGNPLDSAILLTISDEALLSLADNDVTLDNIKLALSQIADERGINTEELYEAILNNASDAVLTSLMLNENGYEPELKGQTWSNNEKKLSVHQLWVVCILVIVLLCIIYKFCVIVYSWLSASAHYFSIRGDILAPSLSAGKIVSSEQCWFPVDIHCFGICFRRIIRIERSQDNEKHSDVLHYVAILIITVIVFTAVYWLDIVWWHIVIDCR